MPAAPLPIAPSAPPRRHRSLVPNASTPPGASLRERHDAGDPACRVILQHEERKGSRWYLEFPTAEAAVAHVLDTPVPQRAFLESICNDPCAVYFDGDLEASSLPDGAEGLRRISRDDFEEGVACWVLQWLLELLTPEAAAALELSSRSLLVSTGHREGKLSVHVLVPCLHFRGARDRYRFKQLLLRRSDLGRGILGLGHPIIDDAPYSGTRDDSTQQLRFVPCNKCGKQNWLAPKAAPHLHPWPEGEGREAEAARALRSMAAAIAPRVRQEGRPIMECLSNELVAVAMGEGAGGGGAVVLAPPRKRPREGGDEAKDDADDGEARPPRRQAQLRLPSAAAENRASDALHAFGDRSSRCGRAAPSSSAARALLLQTVRHAPRCCPHGVRHESDGAHLLTFEGSGVDGATTNAAGNADHDAATLYLCVFTMRECLAATEAAGVPFLGLPRLPSAAARAASPMLRSGELVEGVEERRDEATGRYAYSGRLFVVRGELLASLCRAAGGARLGALVGTPNGLLVRAWDAREDSDFEGRFPRPVFTCRGVRAKRGARLTFKHPWSEPTPLAIYEEACEAEAEGEGSDAGAPPSGRRGAPLPGADETALYRRLTRMHETLVRAGAPVRALADAAQRRDAAAAAAEGG